MEKANTIFIGIMFGLWAGAVIVTLLSGIMDSFANYHRR